MIRKNCIQWIHTTGNIFTVDTITTFAGWLWIVCYAAVIGSIGNCWCCWRLWNFRRPRLNA
uniref:Uncharacterized protein MANES_06G110100 n=1 Tax=Rhizophora mucronata TaxID=61149 RepID=A0A2P2L8F6_RHIMU